MVSAMTENTSALGAYLFDLVQAPIRWQVLRSALVLGVFDVLGEGDSASDVADRLGLKAERTVSFLDALVAMGLLRKTGGVYSPASGAAAYLASDSPTSLARSLLQLGGLRHVGIERLPDLLRGVEQTRPCAEGRVRQLPRGAGR